jgi:hypothetical protein
MLSHVLGPPKEAGMMWASSVKRSNPQIWQGGNGRRKLVLCETFSTQWGPYRREPA